MSFCTPGILMTFMMSLSPGQVYMGDNADFHMGIAGDLDKRFFVFPDADGQQRCYMRGTFKGECIGRNTYRMTLEAVDRKSKSITYTSTVKMSTGNWKFSNVHRKSFEMDGFCGAVHKGELVLDMRRGK